MKLSYLKSIAALFVVFAPHAAFAQADTYPNKPIRIIVPFPAGGATDIAARAIADKMSANWKQPVLVENRAGAGGNVGADYVAKSTPDGHTLVMGITGSHEIGRARVGKECLWLCRSRWSPYH